MQVETSIDEADVGFVHQCGGLQGVAGTFAPEVDGSTTSQLAVDKGRRAIASVGIACVPRTEERGDVVGRGAHGGVGPILMARPGLVNHTPRTRKTTVPDAGRTVSFCVA